MCFLTNSRGSPPRAVFFSRTAKSNLFGRRITAYASAFSLSSFTNSNIIVCIARVFVRVYVQRCKRALWTICVALSRGDSRPGDPLGPAR